MSKHDQPSRQPSRTPVPVIRAQSAAHSKLLGQLSLNFSRQVGPGRHRLDFARYLTSGKSCL